MPRLSMRADVAIAGHGWTVLDTDPRPEPPLSASFVGDGLQLVRALPTDQPWPALPNPARCQLSVYAASALELADIVLGAPVSVRWRSPREAATALEAFDGLVTDVELVPHWLGVRLNVVAVEYYAQLNELQVTGPGPGGDTGEVLTDRAARWLTEAGQPSPLVWVPVGGEPDPRTSIPLFPPTVASKSADDEKASLGVMLDKLMSGWITNAYEVGRTYGAQNRGPARFQHVPVFSAYDSNGLRTLTGWGFTPLFRDSRVGVLPGLFGDTGDGWGVVMDPLTAPAGRDPVVSASLVDFDAAYYQAKGVAVPNTISATWVELVTDTERKVWTYVESNGDAPAVVAELDTGATFDNASQVADFYLPEQGTTALSWSAESFTWRLYADAAGRYLPAELGRQVTVVGTLGPSNPRGLDYFAGLLSGYTLTVSRARPVVSFDLRSATGRLLSDAADLGVRWSDIPAGVTWSELREQQTWDDYKLVRRAP